MAFGRYFQAHRAGCFSDLPEVISEVADAMEAAENVGVWVEWTDKVIKEIPKVKGHQKFVHTANLIRERIEVLQRQLYVLADELNQVES